MWLHVPQKSERHFTQTLSTCARSPCGYEMHKRRFSWDKEQNQKLYTTIDCWSTRGRILQLGSRQPACAPTQVKLLKLGMLRKTLKGMILDQDLKSNLSNHCITYLRPQTSQEVQPGWIYHLHGHWWVYILRRNCFHDTRTRQLSNWGEPHSCYLLMNDAQRLDTTEPKQCGSMMY